ncbi:hypothetical protein ACP70R_042489 [Stipagrostis hirtigluma subsp. patula]
MRLATARIRRSLDLELSMKSVLLDKIHSAAMRHIPVALLRSGLHRALLKAHSTNPLPAANLEARTHFMISNEPEEAS